MSKKKKEKSIDIQIRINKKDSFGLFSNFPAKTFDSANRRDKEKKNTRKYLDEEF